MNLAVNVQPGLLLTGREVVQNLYEIAHHLFANSRHQGRAFGRDADHYLAAILPRARAHDVTEVFQPCDQTARRRRGVTHLPRDRRHREHFLLIEISEKKKLRKRNIARHQLFAQMQHEAALHLQDDMGKSFGVGTNSIGRISCKPCGNSRIQRAKAKSASWRVKHLARKNYAVTE